jgi:hypothetical protein
VAVWRPADDPVVVPTLPLDTPPPVIVGVDLSPGPTISVCAWSEPLDGHPATSFVPAQLTDMFGFGVEAAAGTADTTSTPMKEMTGSVIAASANAQAFTSTRTPRGCTFIFFSPSL